MNPSSPFFLLLLFIINQGTASDSIKINDTGLKCPYPKDHPIHADPYFNSHLHEYFNPNQVDFSKEYYSMRRNILKEHKPAVDLSLNLDFSQLWIRRISQNGIIGKNYQRIKIIITETLKDTVNSNLYYIRGKSKVKSNICDFLGTITVKNILVSNHQDTGTIVHGSLFAEYIFSESEKQKGTGTFKGILESFFIYEIQTYRIALDTVPKIADGYFNNTFVGIWKSYRTSKLKKCIWGEYRLPFTFDFDVGDTEMRPNPQYFKSGWSNFSAKKGEYKELSDGTLLEKNPWW